jgi:hypothetical protein
MTDKINVLSNTCITFSNGQLALVLSEEGVWIMINKAGKVIWSER